MPGGFARGLAREVRAAPGARARAVRRSRTRAVHEWLAQQENAGRRFNDEQRQWLEAIRDHFAANAEVSADDFEYVPFNKLGGLGRAHRVFGPELAHVVEELNGVLAA